MRNKWTKYADLDDTVLPTDHLLLYEFLTEDMRDAVMSASKSDSLVSSQSSPSESQSGSPKHWGNPVEWWDSECIEVVTNRAASLKKFKQSGLYVDFVEYKKYRAKAIKTINSKKKKSFIEFINSINKFSNLTYVWNKMRILKKSFRTIDWNKWQNKDRRQAIYKTIEEISPDWVGEPKITSNYHNRLPTCNLNNNITKEEVLRALNIKKNSSPGMDGIEYKM
ncbi:unnamed protein product [Lasius platythorax]|uniref:Glycosyltransferase family 92 protein n=1 Tax=Lasius platythorax TaxID=488582 RepID=A0AAV2NBJ4_9HYME